MSTENRADLDAGTALAVCDVLIQLLMLILVRVDFDPPGPNRKGALLECGESQLLFNNFLSSPFQTLPNSTTDCLS